jgi:hypothetical protein
VLNTWRGSVSGEGPRAHEEYLRIVAKHLTMHATRPRGAHHHAPCTPAALT